MLRPDVAVVTSVGSEHNRVFGSLSVTREQKSAMVRALPDSGVAVLNGDDPNVRWMEHTTTARVLTFGFDPSNQVVGSDFRLDWPHGSTLRIEAGGQACHARIRLIGRHSVYAALAAVAVAVEIGGRSLEEAVARIEGLPPTPGRMHPVRLNGGEWLLRDDNKSALETVEAALDTLSKIPALRRIVVMGAVSEPPGQQRQLYRELGSQVAEIAQSAIFVCGRKTFEAYRSGGRARVDTEFHPMHVRNVRGAIDRLEREIRAGDVVLVKGRDTQRLERIALALQDRTVNCNLEYCNTKAVRCADCPMLERG
jgi:UDP-N-acetylmuramoyl-tripeptide--D-alanyl-D-alanine ligase